jgi:hypothetical protein
MLQPNESALPGYLFLRKTVSTLRHEMRIFACSEHKPRAQAVSCGGGGSAVRNFVAWCGNLLTRRLDETGAGCIMLNWTH